MTNINFGNKPVYSQSYPAYPNCFDMLAMHGIVAEDPMEYMTGTPSPYLQNYVAQRGGAPSLSGQLVPENLPPLPQQAPMPNGDFCQQGMPTQNNIPLASDLKSNIFTKNKTWNKVKKIVAAGLVTGLIILAAVKGKGLVSKISKFFKKAPTAQTAQAAGQTAQNAGQAVQTAVQSQGVQTAANTTATSTSKWGNKLKYAFSAVAGGITALGLNKLFSNNPKQEAGEMANYSDAAIHGSQPLTEPENMESTETDQVQQPDMSQISVPIASQSMQQPVDQTVANPPVQPMIQQAVPPMVQPVQPQVISVQPQPMPIQPQIMPMQQVPVTTA